MNHRVTVSSWASWTPAGVTLKGDRIADALWTDSPPFSELHPRARRPPPAAVAWVRLAHLLLVGRPSGPDLPPLRRPEVELLVGTVYGSAAADNAFLKGIGERGFGLGSPSTFVYTLPTAAPAEAALALGLRGGLLTVTAGGVSGLAAVARAMARIEQGDTRACLCGGMEGDRLALFLLEADLPGLPLLEDGLCGWAPTGDPSAGDPLEALIELLNEVSRGGTGRPLDGRSPDGHWARLRVTSPRPQC